MNYGLSLRAALARYGINVSVICSGFVETPMIADIHGPKPFNMPADRAARLIRRGLARHRAVVMFPWFFAMVSRIDGLLPDGLRRWLAARQGTSRAVSR